jgi:hypothetical protein
LVALVLGPAVFGGCQEGSSGARLTDGRLGREKPEGHFAVDPPRREFATYEATFGTLLLCLEREGAPVELEGVRAVVPGQKFSSHVRVVTPAMVEETPKRERYRFVPLFWGLGSPPDFRQPYASFRIAGEYISDVKGVVISGGCDDVKNAGGDIGSDKVPRTDFVELMITVPATAAKGGRLDGVYVDYVDGGVGYTMEILWQMVVCDKQFKRPECAVGRREAN